MKITLSAFTLDNSEGSSRNVFLIRGGIYLYEIICVYQGSVNEKWQFNLGVRNKKQMGFRGVNKESRAAGGPCNELAGGGGFHK